MGMKEGKNAGGMRSWADLTGLVEAAPGFAELARAVRADGSGAIDGAWGSSSALAVAALARGKAKTILVVLAHAGDLDTWAGDLATLAGSAPVVFPAADRAPAEEEAIDEEQTQRLRVLKQLTEPHPPRLVLTTIGAVMQPTPSRKARAASTRALKVGGAADLEALSAWLVDRGFAHREVVELPGEFSRRGGILDVYPPAADAPARIEFFGDEIETIRTFSTETQRSATALHEFEIGAWLGRPASGEAAETEPMTAYLPAGSLVALIEPAELQEQGRVFLERSTDVRGLLHPEAALAHLLKLPYVAISTLPAGGDGNFVCHLHVTSVERFSGDINKLRDELTAVAGGDAVIVACGTEAEQHRMQTLLGDSEEALPVGSRLNFWLGHIRDGFRLPHAGVVVLSANELLRRERLPGQSTLRPLTRKYEARAIDSFLDLADGDLVVHLSHGIGRYLGMQLLEDKGHSEEHLVLEFADAVKLYVPASKIDLVQKYVGTGAHAPPLSKLGGVSWQKRKERVQAAVLDLAAEMIELQAQREHQPGIAYPPDSDWQAEFEASFPYAETPDQLSALADIRGDMHKPRPMDRLLCGDVGFGKTELAIRAAFKAMDFGKQAAVLVPTTVLAEQHFRTFSNRLAQYPFAVDCISRFRTHGEQRDIVGRLAEGKIDLIIGTHRLLSADVKFKDLGLVIIDEEQRFGVEHKERLKKLRATVDVLTLTATPIPRTLHMAVLGIRDISSLQTPPRDRIAIETRVTRFDANLVRQAILRELNREGQVYFVHNRVYNIHLIAKELQAIVPEARIGVGHGQMNEHELEATMLSFVNREIDVLVATTIIESGLDIPNANTIFINQADMYGLADLHQLRGRVGRYKHRAYCYLLLDRDRMVTPLAYRRLKAIEEYSELGAGFKIAMRDLEIRGAGNILGTQQSGHIAAVGYELYCQLLENAARQLKNQPARTVLEVQLDLPWKAHLPHDYVPGQKARIELYRRLARVRQTGRLTDFREELHERFGPLPEPVEWLLRSQELRVAAAKWQIASIHLDGIDLVLKYRNRRRIGRLADISGKRLRVVDEESAYYRLQAQERTPQRLYGVLKALLQRGDGEV
jgi:transcription-repair coupling factor (superfamily II helicase)